MKRAVCWRRVAAIVLRQYYLFRGSPVRILPLFAWVAIDIVLWGFITRYLNSVASAQFDFVPALLGAVLLWDFFARVMHGVSTAFLEDVWSRNFINTFASPLTVLEYVLGLVITTLFTAAVGLAVMVLLSAAIFRFSFFSYGLLAIPSLAILLLFGIALGIIGSALVLRFGPASEWLVWPIPAFIAPFAAVFYPVDTLPQWMRAVAALTPPSYVFEALRTIASGNAPSLSPLIVSGVIAVLYVAGSCLVFVRVYRYAVRTGLLARYSAESS